MPNEIPEVPQGIRDQNNLLNDEAWRLPKPVRWTDPELHDRILWIQEECDRLGLRNVKTGDWMATSLIDRQTGAEIVQETQYVLYNPEVNQTVGVYQTMWQPAVVVGALITNSANAWEPAKLAGITNYPGYNARHNSTQQFIGAPWPEHPRAKQLKAAGSPFTVYRDLSTDDKWPADNSTVLELESGDYVRSFSMVPKATRPGMSFGGGYTRETYWEMRYKRSPK